MNKHQKMGSTKCETDLDRCMDTKKKSRFLHLLIVACLGGGLGSLSDLVGYYFFRQATFCCCFFGVFTCPYMTVAIKQLTLTTTLAVKSDIITQFLTLTKRN